MGREGLGWLQMRRASLRHDFMLRSQSFVEDEEECVGEQFET